MSTDVQTVRDDERSRYEGLLDGEVVTVLAFVRRGDVLTSPTRARSSRSVGAASPAR